MTYDCLIASGCSHTYGAEMADIGEARWPHQFKHPSKNAWPQVLGDYLNISDVHNVSRPGASNDYIVRTITKEVEKHKDKKILVGMMFSIISRTEFVMDNDWNGAGPWIVERDWAPEWIKKFYVEYQNDFTNSYNAFKNLHYIQSQLSDKDIDYFVMFSNKRYYPNSQLEVENDDLKRFDTIIDKSTIVNTTPNASFSGTCDWCNVNNYHLTSGGHYLEDAYKDFVGEVLGPWVKEKYDV